jgi:hypothetical protein
MLGDGERKGSSETSGDDNGTSGIFAMGGGVPRGSGGGIAFERSNLGTEGGALSLIGLFATGVGEAGRVCIGVLGSVTGDLVGVNGNNCKGERTTGGLTGDNAALV